jgi:hypothetical protein
MSLLFSQTATFFRTVKDTGAQYEKQLSDLIKRKTMEGRKVGATKYHRQPNRLEVRKVKQEARIVG